MNKLYFGDNLHILREQPAMAHRGWFVTLTEPTRPMTQEAVSAGFYDERRFGADPAAADRSCKS